MKRIAVVIREFREQIEEATKPGKPEVLRNYTKVWLDGLGSVIEELPNDPTIAAIAFHDMFRFKDRGLVELIGTIIERGEVASEDWEPIGQKILVYKDAKDAVSLLEANGLRDVLVLAAVANFCLQKGLVKDTVEMQTITEGESHE